jgi:hypothetical protein
MAIQKNSTHKFTSIQTQYFLFATSQPVDTFAMAFANSSLDLFSKPTNVSLQLMELVHAFKKEWFVFF